MRAEEAREHLARAQGRDDEQRSCRRGNIHGDSFVIGAQFFKRADQTVRMPDHAGA